MRLRRLTLFGLALLRLLPTWQAEGTSALAQHLLEDLAERIVAIGALRLLRLALRLLCAAAEHVLQHLAERVVAVRIGRRLRPWQLRAASRLPHHFLDDFAERVAAAEAAGGLHLAGGLLEKAAHHHRGHRRQHLLQHLLAEPGRLRGLGGDGA